MEKTIRKIGKKHVLESPTIEGGGKLTLLLKDIESVTYKEVTKQRTKPNGDKIGKAVVKVYLLVTARGRDYSVECLDLQEADALYCRIQKLM